MAHRVLAFAGSPRRGGNSEALLDSALAGVASALSEVEGPALSEVEGPALSEVEGPALSEVEGAASPDPSTPLRAGAEVRKIVLNELAFRPCQNCGGCNATGYCRFAAADDMKGVYEALDASDRFLVASPIYFASVSAQLKAMIDRCQAIWARKYLLKRKHPNEDRKALFLSCGGFKHDRFYACARQVVAAWCAVLDIRLSGELFFHSIDAPGDIGRHPTALADAFRAGRELME